MSGGAWEYMSERLAETGQQVSEAMRLLGALERELDWGVSCDTCLDCAKLRAVAALLQFFEDRATCATAAVAIARDSEQNRCAACSERDAERRRKAKP